ncbi:MAG TPA: PEP-CTERM sorting domain-containing protein [Gemmatimonadaceae bacterium]|nr:PEP-CTERM sorting domain-containing protein [Gemmatimonadaceae bacterium]
MLRSRSLSSSFVVAAFAVAAAATTVPVAPLAAQTTIDFTTLGYGGPDCLWGGGPVDITNHQGFDFFGLRPLDLPNYNGLCWGGTGQQHGYLNGPGQTLPSVVGLGFGRAQVQTLAATPFNLRELSFGAGWSNVTLSIRGYTDFYSADDQPWAVREDITLSPGTLQTVDFTGLGFTGLTFFSINVEDWGQPQFTHWGTGAPMTEQTYFVSGMTYSLPAQVPEPATAGLVLLGAGVLGLVARRRR